MLWLFAFVYVAFRRTASLALSPAGDVKATVTLSVAPGSMVVDDLFAEQFDIDPHDAVRLYTACRLPLFCTVNVFDTDAFSGTVDDVPFGVTYGVYEETGGDGGGAKPALGGDDTVLIARE